VRRIAVDRRNELAVGLEIGDPAAADTDKPQIALVVERTAFEKFGLRRVLDVGEFLDRPDPGRQRRQPPGLDRAGVSRLRRSLGDGRTNGGAEGSEQRKGQSLDQGSSAHGVGSSRLNILAAYIRSAVTPFYD